MSASSTLTLRLIDANAQSTISSLRYGSEHLCFILEDESRDVKVRGETRIPAGKYEIVRRYAGRHFDQYTKRYRHVHTFHIINVPGFEWIMIHIGNTTADTLGCLLTGTGVLFVKDRYETRGSATAYVALYDILTTLTAPGKRLFIDVDRGAQ